MILYIWFANEVFAKGITGIVNNKDYVITSGIYKGGKAVSIDVRDKVPSIPIDTVYLSINYKKDIKIKTTFPKIPATVKYLELNKLQDSKIPQLNKTLDTLVIEKCPNLKTLNDLSYIMDLESLNIYNCKNLQRIMSKNLPRNITGIVVHGAALKSFPANLPISLEYIDFSNSGLKEVVRKKKRGWLDYLVNLYDIVY